MWWPRVDAMPSHRRAVDRTRAEVDRMRRNRQYRKGELELEDFGCSRIDDLLAEPDTVVWLTSTLPMTPTSPC
jgi:hypothetical protein